MATRQTITAADGWIEIASEGAAFLLENLGPDSVRVFFGASPGAESDYHELPPPRPGRPPYAMTRTAAGAVYVATAGWAEIVSSA